MCPQDICMSTSRHVLRAAVRRIRLCLKGTCMCTSRPVLRATVHCIHLFSKKTHVCTSRHALRAAVRGVCLRHQCTCVSVGMYYSEILCAVFTCASKTYVCLSTGMWWKLHCLVFACALKTYVCLWLDMYCKLHIRRQPWFHFSLRCSKIKWSSTKILWWGEHVLVIGGMK